MHTVNSLAALLGLDNPEVYFTASKIHSPYYPIRSGRTTTMILRACIAAQDSPVLILGGCSSFTKRHQLEARRYCKAAGIPSKNILDVDIPLEKPIEVKPGIRVFVDHLRIEKQSTVLLGNKSITLEKYLMKVLREPYSSSINEQTSVSVKTEYDELVDKFIELGKVLENVRNNKGN